MADAKVSKTASPNAKTRNRVTDAYNNGMQKVGGFWQRFKENSLVQGVSRGISKFGRSVQNMKEDFTVGYHAYCANRGERHFEQLRELMAQKGYVLKSTDSLKNMQQAVSDVTPDVVSTDAPNVASPGDAPVPASKKTSKPLALPDNQAQADQPDAPTTPDAADGQADPGKVGDNTDKAPGDAGKLNPPNVTLPSPDSVRKVDVNHVIGKGKFTSYELNPVPDIKKGKKGKQADASSTPDAAATSDAPADDKTSGGYVKNTAAALTDNSNMGVDAIIASIQAACNVYTGLSADEQKANFGAFVDMMGKMSDNLTALRTAQADAAFGDAAVPDSSKDGPDVAQPSDDGMGI